MNEERTMVPPRQAIETEIEMECYQLSREELVEIIQRQNKDIADMQARLDIIAMDEEGLL